MIRILFTGGGTGGHISPILAVSEELQILGTGTEMDLRYFGVPGNYKKLLEENGISVSRILPAKMRRYFDVRNFIDILILLPLSIIQALWKVFWFMPDILFSKGGTGSLPVVLACRFYRIPVLIHDSDSVMGLANKIAVHFAKRVAVSFSSTIVDLDPKGQKMTDKIALIGNPIRRFLTSIEIDSVSAKNTFGLSMDKPVILVIGGSQGAVKLNNFMLGAAGELVKRFQILHQTGMKNFEGVKGEINLILKNLSEEEKKNYKIFPYFEKEMKDAYVAADLVVSRSGSASIFEIAAFGKPSILIPLPEDVVGVHQVKNAYEYAKTGAAIVIEEPNLKTNLFMSQAEKLFSDPEKLKTMSEAAKKFAKPQAGKLIAEEILRMIERN